MIDTQAQHNGAEALQILSWRWCVRREQRRHRGITSQQLSGFAQQAALEIPAAEHRKRAALVAKLQLLMD